jgi:hypothetical protein
MQLAMMRATDGDGIFVADLSPERAGLGKTKMMRVGRRAAAHDARLAGLESGVLLVAQANGLAHDTVADGMILADLCKGAEDRQSAGRPRHGGDTTRMPKGLERA